MSTSFAGLNISSLSVAQGSAVVLGALSLMGGINAVVSPAKFPTGFGFAPSSPHTRSAASNPFVYVLGGRQIAGGLALLTCAYFELDKAIGITMMTGFVAGLVDGHALWTYEEPIDESKTGGERTAEVERVEKAQQSAWAHWMFNSIYPAIGAWIFYRS